MDGHFVPNISFGPAVVKALRPLSRMTFDVHLMCARPEILLEPFAIAGADRITVHVELGVQVVPLIWKIRSLGRQVGLAINPPTSMSSLEPHLDQVDLVLIMTVNPGFGGQEFITECLTKIQQAAAWRDKRWPALPHRRGWRRRFQHGGQLRRGGRGHLHQRHRPLRAQEPCRRRGQNEEAGRRRGICLTVTMRLELGARPSRSLWPASRRPVDKNPRFTDW